MRGEWRRSELRPTAISSASRWIDHFNAVLDQYPLMRRTMESVAAERYKLWLGLFYRVGVLLDVNHHSHFHINFVEHCVLSDRASSVIFLLSKHVMSLLFNMLLNMISLYVLIWTRYACFTYTLHTQEKTLSRHFLMINLYVTVQNLGGESLQQVRTNSSNAHLPQMRIQNELREF